MKKLIATSLLLIAPVLAYGAGAPVSGRSASVDAGSGCGLGTLLFDGNSGVGAHAVAMTTNSFLFNNTFGMSSGTLGCDSSTPVRYRGEHLYISANMTRLAEDMSRGQGEVLAGLAEVMKIAPADKQAFYALTQRNFDRIYTSEAATSEQVVAALVKAMKADGVLAKYVA